MTGPARFANRRRTRGSGWVARVAQKSRYGGLDSLHPGTPSGGAVRARSSGVTGSFCQAMTLGHAMARAGNLSTLGALLPMSTPRVILNR